jgi:hypothetical protein
MKTIKFNPVVGMALTHAVRQVCGEISAGIRKGPIPAVERVELTKHTVVTSAIVKFNNGPRVKVILDGERVMRTRIS